MMSSRIVLEDNDKAIVTNDTGVQCLSETLMKGIVS